MGSVAIIIFVLIVLVAGGVLLWALLQDAFINIKPGEMGLVISRGKPADHGLAPGVHFALRFGRVIEVYPSVEMTYLTVGEGDAASTPADTITFVDPPVRVALGDGTAGIAQYTVRFKITEDGLPTIHLRFGQNGIKSFVRDESRRVVIDGVADASVRVTNVRGSALPALEERLGALMAESLGTGGFEVTMFNIRGIDLGETGALIQSTLRASEELAREQAMGTVRAVRAEQEAAINARLAGSLSAATLEYLRLQATRELIERWDGKLLMPPGTVGMFGDGGATQAADASAPETQDGGGEQAGA